VLQSRHWPEAQLRPGSQGPQLSLSPRAPPSRPWPGSHSPARAPSLRDEYLQSFDLRAFVERHRQRLHHPETAFYVSQALEECAVTRAPSGLPDIPAEERRAAHLLAEHCRGFEGEPIEPAAILEMLRYAARWGEPHALARMLLLRDIAAPKDDALPDLPWMLTSREPSIVRDVGAFLSRGEAERRYGDERVPTAVAAIAWELAACDLDQSCDPSGRFALAQCASLGRCSEWRYEDAVALFEPPELMAAAQRLRAGILRALRNHDWEWLGLG
jgi:hypothetical protein